MKFVNLENKTLSELIELRRCCAGYDTFAVVDSFFKSAVSEQYDKMLVRTRRRDYSQIRRYGLRISHYR